jgi:hypothetical protein
MTTLDQRGDCAHYKRNGADLSKRAFDKNARTRKIGFVNAEVAQLVEHAAENRGVSSSILLLGTISWFV